MIEWLNAHVGLMTILVGFIAIVAMMYAPIMALKRQKNVSDKKKKEEAKKEVFAILLATRSNKISFEHVKALNMIDVVFHGDKKIIDSWAIYRDHLNNHGSNPNKTEDAAKCWIEKGEDYFTDLLYDMSQYLGYKLLLKEGLIYLEHMGLTNLNEIQLEKDC